MCQAVFFGRRMEEGVAPLRETLMPDTSNRAVETFLSGQLGIEFGRDSMVKRLATCFACMVEGIHLHVGWEGVPCCPRIGLFEERQRGLLLALYLFFLRGC